MLVKFLKDYARDGDKIVVETYDPNTVHTQSGDGSKQYQVSIGFLGIFDVSHTHHRADWLALPGRFNLQVVGSVDPSTHTVTGSLYVRVPFIGRVRICGIQGSLGSTDGIKAEVDAFVAKGIATLTDGMVDGKRDLFIQLTLSVKFKGNISTGKYHLLTLP